MHNGLATSYYPFGDRRVALREGPAVSHLFADHLGSTRAVDTGAGTPAQQYTPWGDIVESWANTLPTEYTGQREASATGGLRLLDYGARHYAPWLGRLISPDSIVPSPGNPQALNRYSYVFGNPLKLTDPTGHKPKPPSCTDGVGGSCEDVGQKMGVARVRRVARALGQAASVYASARFEDAVPDVYFKGVVASGGATVYGSIGIQEVWDAKHLTYGVVTSRSSGVMASPGGGVSVEVGFGEYGPPLSNGKGTNFQDYLGPANELSVGYGQPIGPVPVAGAITIGTSASYAEPGKEVRTASLQVGLGSPGASAGLAQAQYREVSPNLTVAYPDRTTMALAFLASRLAAPLTVSTTDLITLGSILYPK